MAGHTAVALLASLLLLWLPNLAAAGDKDQAPKPAPGRVGKYVAFN